MIKNNNINNNDSQNQQPQQSSAIIALDSGLLIPLVARIHRQNFIGLLLACVNHVALIMVGNYRCSEAFVMHSIGGLTSFHVTIIYVWYLINVCEQLSVRFKIESRPTTMRVGVIVQMMGLFGMFLFNIISGLQFGTNQVFIESVRIHWTRDQPGYWWHVMGTSSEWILVSCNCVLFACLYRRMKQFKEWHKIDL